MRMHRYALALAVLIAAIAAAAAAAGPIVDYSVPAAHETEPVILTGAQLGSWSASQDFNFKLPLTDLKDCQSFDDKCKHNNYADPEVEFAPQQGTPTDRFLGYRWTGKAWQQIPFQVDEQFTRYLDNSASGFSDYSGEDQHTTYAYDREGFRYRKEDPADPCHALPDDKVAQDPVRGLDNNDELVFMAKDAGTAAPAGTALPAGMEGAKQVVLTDPSNPSAAPGYAYVMLAKEGGPKPAFDASNGYVRYYRDADADQFRFSQSSYEGYGNAPRGRFYDAQHGGCVGADPADIKDPKLCTYVDDKGKVKPVQDPGTKNQYGDDEAFWKCPQRHRPFDGTWVTTPHYQFRYDGRWLLTKLETSTDGGQTYGADMIDRWKARAFQQDPESNTPCCGFEEEDTNWGGSSTLLGERVGPVRAIRETWGADSGTNVIRRETFYAQQIRQKSYLRVHVIPPLDGIYAQWDFNAGRVDTYFNPVKDSGVPVNGHNDEAFGNFDDPCTQHYDQNDTGDLTQGYRKAYQQLTLCTTGQKIYDDCPGGYCHQSIDLMDPSFSGAPNASLNWNEVTGSAGTLVDRITIEKAQDLTPGGAAQSAFAIPYYRDDSCFDDGTGSDPGPKLHPRGKMMDEATVPGTDPPVARHCWNQIPGGDPTAPNPADPRVPDGDPHFFQGDIGTHGVHILLIAESDNARQTVPLTEIVSEWRMAVLPPNQGNVGERYGRSFEKPLVPLVTDFQAGPGEAPQEPPSGGSGGGPAPYPGESTSPSQPPANTQPEASESGVLGARATRPCLPAGQLVSSRGIGKFRLGHRPSQTIRSSGAAVHGQKGVLVWCVRGGGRILVAFSKRGDARLIASTAPTSSARGITVGDSVREIRRKYRDSRRLSGGLMLSHDGSTRIVFTLTGKHVHSIAVVDRRLLKSRVLMRRYLAAVDD